MKLIITHRGDGEWLVWAGYDLSDPTTDHFGFVIGVGGTCERAIADALNDLHVAAGSLQDGASQIEQRELGARTAVGHTR